MAKVTSQQFDVIYRKASESIEQRKKLLRNEYSKLTKAHGKIVEAMRLRWQKKSQAKVVKFIKSLKKEDMIQALLDSYNEDQAPIFYRGGHVQREGVLDIRKIAGYEEATKSAYRGEVGEMHDPENSAFTAKEQERLFAIAKKQDEIGVKLSRFDGKLQDFMDAVVLDGNADLMSKLQEFDESCQFIV
jgi:hypothetical protein